MVRHVHVGLVLVLGLVLALAACKKKAATEETKATEATGATEPTEPMDPLVEETMAKLTEARDKGCACPNLQCVTQVQNDLGRWYLENAKRLEELTTKATPKQNEAGQKLSAELDACARKLDAAGRAAGP